KISVAPTITTDTLPDGTVGTAYSQSLAATGDSPITWSKESGDLPGGLTLSAGGAISGTPTTGGTFNFTVKAENMAGSDTKELSIKVSVAPTITTDTLPDGTVGTAYSQALAATGDTPITWSIESGVLPNGLTLSAGGTISGTPTTGGTFNFTVKAENAVGSDTRTISIIINPAPPVNNPPVRKAGIDATTIASVVVNTAYTLDLSTIFEDMDVSDTLTYKVSVNDAAATEAEANYSYTPTEVGITTLVFSANDGMTDSTDIYTVTLTANAQTYSLTIIAGTGGTITTGTDGNYTKDTVITIAASPSTNYSFNRWTSTGGGSFADAYSASTTFTMPAGDAIITAEFTYKGGDGTGGNVPYIPQPVEGAKVETPEIEVEVSENKVTAIVAVTAIDNNSGKSTVAVTQTQVSEAISKALEEANKQGSGVTAAVEIKVEAPADAKTVETCIPKEAVELAADGRIETFTVSTPVAAISFDADALSAIAGEAAEDITISASKVETASLPAATQQLVGDRPVFNFSVTSGDKTISQFGSSVSVTMPYTPKDGEDVDAIVIYYINAEGLLETVSNCTYDPATGTVSLKTNHFSQYVIGYNKVSFKDVPEDAWYSKPVGFIAARGITKGTGDNNFSPQAKLTRAECLVMIMRTYGIEPDINPKDNFADAGNTYYTGYLATAKRLGISKGIGNNLYAPDREITRQEMFVLLYNVLKEIGELPWGNSGKQLSEFSDAEQTADWAKEAVTLFVETGVITGYGGRLFAEDTTTRAEMSKVLYNLLTR
ncbi:MAG: S-layer homology domain-containing protein, partial [Clostridiales bacterium]|nr:S-layer homology domain-containing protein [Clostridiales bacterium]